MTACMSEDHDQPVEATTEGNFVNVWTGHTSKANYCAPCATLAQRLGYFRPDPKDQP